MHVEAALGGGGHGGHEAEVVSRAVRENAGLGFGMVLFGVATRGLYPVVALAVGQILRPRLGTWNASLVAGLGFVLVVGAVMAALTAHGGSPLPLRDGEGDTPFPGLPRRRTRRVPAPRPRAGHEVPAGAR